MLPEGVFQVKHDVGYFISVINCRKDRSFTQNFRSECFKFGVLHPGLIQFRIEAAEVVCFGESRSS